MSDQNLSVVLNKILDIRLEDRSMPPEPKEGEVRLRMDSVGICGSDVHYYVNGRIGNWIVRDPMILGHEGAGVIDKVGPGVSGLEPGDAVAIEPQYNCRRCEQCKSGRYNLCPDIFFCATPPDHGNLSRYYLHQADFCHKLPSNMSLEEGALMEPLSVGVHACSRAGVSVGQDVLVCGAGPIGLVSLLAAKARGAHRVVLTDVNQQRLDVARQMGATGTYLVGQGGDAVADICQRFFGGDRPHVTIECSGAEPSINLCLNITKSGGKACLVGMGAPTVNLSIFNALGREVDILGIFRYANCYPAAIRMVSSGLIDVKPLITHRFRLEDSRDAFETARFGKGGAIKVMIKCDKAWRGDKP